MTSGQISAVNPTPNEKEAAAIAAALEAFRRSFAAPAADSGLRMGGWQRAALVEGVNHAPQATAPWGP